MKVISIKILLIGTIIALLTTAVPVSALAKTHKVDCTKKSELQKTIQAADNGDVIEIIGICTENILIEGKGLTLIGADTQGPHGITGVLESTDGVRIQNSIGTHLEGLQIYNPHYTGVRIRQHSTVTMRDCEVSNTAGGNGTGIWVQEMSDLVGYGLRLDNNYRGLGAYSHSDARCAECDLNGSTRAAAISWKGSLVTLLDSVVTGQRGIRALESSYIDFDCLSHDSTHDCSLEADIWAGLASWQSTVVFYHSGDFSGWLRAEDRSKVHLLGARQLVNPSQNAIQDNSSLRVEEGVSKDPGTGDYVPENSRVIGETYIAEFSNGLFYDSSTELVGELTCNSGGDAVVEIGIDMSGLTINGLCAHIPTP